MKKILVAMTIVLASLTACHAQVPPNPTVYSCPSSTGTAYTPINQSSPTTSLAYTDTHPAAGAYCYIVQSEIGAQVSLPSNIAGPFTLSGSNSTSLTWTIPSGSSTPSGYYVSRALATASTLGAPTLGSGTVAQVQTHSNTQQASVIQLSGTVKGR